VCEKETGTRNPRFQPEKPFRYVDITGVNSRTKRIAEARTLLGRDAPSRAREVIFSDDVIVSTTRPNLNAVAVVPPEIHNEICSTGFCVLRAGPNLDPAYLFAFVQTSEFVKNLSDLVKGALYPAVTDSQVREQMIPLPPLEEQKRIAAILNEQMAAVERARAAAEARLEAAKALPAAFLRESLKAGLRQRLPLEKCLVEISNGVGPDWSKHRLVGATRAGLAPAKEAIGKRPERYKLAEHGTIFYNPMRILLGSIAMIDEEDEPAITSPDYVVFKTVEGLLHPRWFYFWLRSSDGDSFIKTLTRGAVRERMLFRRLSKAEIVLPPWPAQVAAAERMKGVTRLVRRIAEEIEAIEVLPRALLRRAFNGEL
jgi:type I restriction enzyme S subunit